MGKLSLYIWEGDDVGGDIFGNLVVLAESAEAARILVRAEIERVQAEATEWETESRRLQRKYNTGEAWHGFQTSAEGAAYFARQFPDPWSFVNQNLKGIDREPNRVIELRHAQIVAYNPGIDSDSLDGG
jgi:hypothetical protein